VYSSPVASSSSSGGGPLASHPLSSWSSAGSASPSPRAPRHPPGAAAPARPAASPGGRAEALRPREADAAEDQVALTLRALERSSCRSRAAKELLRAARETTPSTRPVAGSARVLVDPFLEMGSARPPHRFDLLSPVPCPLAVFTRRHRDPRSTATAPLSTPVPDRRGRKEDRLPVRRRLLLDDSM